jgi:N-methylhydantoinase A/oxoprolinase/acetone carboxylase beta subunit
MSINGSYFLGIDTGGTFTDGVLLDPHSQKVVKTTKVLTTHYDLSLCIAEVLDRLVGNESLPISMVSLSTTLATNAIAEGKRNPVALFLLGYDEKLVHTFNFQSQFGTPHYFFIPGRHGLDGIEQVPLNEDEITNAVSSIKEKVEAFAVSSYAGPRNTAHEERAADLVASLASVPIVKAHHLSSELDSIRRATTASLNASLLSNVHEFLEAVQRMLAEKHIHCPVMMVKGDGSIVKTEYTRTRPVEVIHSGPATSAIGGQFLAGTDSALVIDVGGTTTDISLVENGKIQVDDNAATVGPYRTCVKTIKARSFGLGGDSLIRFDYAQSLSIGPERVLPFAHLCHEFPEVKTQLTRWLMEKKEFRFYDQLEYWILRREPRHTLENSRAQKAIQLLKEGPQLLPKILKQAGAVSPIQLNVDELVGQEIIERAGLTPTDILHVTGEFAPWDAEISRLVIETISQSWGITSQAFIQRIRDLITERVVIEVVEFLTGKTLSATPGSFNSHLDTWLVEENLAAKDKHLESHIVLKDPIVGIGAPAGAFLPSVAEALGTRLLLPEHYAVANAVGTVVGNVMVHLDGSVSPMVEGTVVTGYFGRAGNFQQQFNLFNDACEFTGHRLVEQVTEQARLAGAFEPVVEISNEEVLPGMMSKLSAWAVGKPNLDGHEVAK